MKLVDLNLLLYAVNRDSGNQAIAVVDSWLARPQVLVLDPAEEHWRLLRNVLTETGTAGNLTTDAHLAALAIEHDAELCSSDGDFARFGQLRWTNPMTG